MALNGMARNINSRLMKSAPGGTRTPGLLLVRSQVIGIIRFLRRQLIKIACRGRHRQVCKLQIRERNAHRACERRRIHPLDLYAETAAALESSRSSNGTLMCGARIGFIGSCHPRRLVDPPHGWCAKRIRSPDPRIMRVQKWLQRNHDAKHERHVYV
jgi:hypothetical protein